MSLDDLILERRNEAEGVVALCEGPLGFWAGPTEETVEQPGYKRMYWTRDLARSIQTLLDLGHGEKVRDHLDEIKL